MLRRIALALIACPIAPALAQSASPTDVVRLSPADREAAIEAGAARATSELPINGLTRGVHGEIGTEFGSHGERAFFGAGSVPLGNGGAASFSFLTDRIGRTPGY